VNIVVWVVQVLLTIAFLGAGTLKLTQPREALLERMPYVEDLPGVRVKIVGTIEVLGALGVILPSLTGIAPILAPIAATGLALVMVGAASLHIKRKEYSAIAINAVLFALAVFVAWARFGPYAL
jgi:uncharacterized membrane protein